MNVLDLFSGIGGFSLGLERAGMRTVAFCEINPYSRRLLAQHWPGVPIYDDVRTLTGARLSADGIGVDVICGGFPCQDISTAGKRAGIEGSRSGLWAEYARLIGELRPRFVIVENVAALLIRGLDRVLGDLAALGFDAEWHGIPACALGADHARDRIWIVAYRPGLLGPEIIGSEQDGDLSRHAAHGLHPHAHGSNRPIWQGFGRDVRQELEAIERGGGSVRAWDRGPFDDGEVDDGLSAPVDALDGYGNAVVPQIPELIGRAIMTCVMEKRG